MSKFILITSVIAMVAGCSVKITRDTTGNLAPSGSVGFIKTFSGKSYSPIARETVSPAVDTTQRMKEKEDAVVFQVP